MKRCIVAAFFGLLLVVSVASVSAVDREEVDDLRRLAAWLTGSFTSTAQAEADSNFFDIRLEMVPIWTDRNDGLWMYVEQASAAALDRPYRQRVYHLTADSDGSLVSTVYSISEPLRFAGAYADTKPLNALSPDSLMLRDGCEIRMTFTDGAFVGATGKQTCGSTLRGASWATSEVTIHADRLETLDQGWDDDGNQVWGSEHGPYIFVRVR